MKLIIVLMILLIVPFVMAGLKTDYELCQGQREIYQNCSMITPTLNCPTLNYEIINMTGGVEVASTLAPFNGSLYYFNFTVPEGDYVVRLCDNTTREVRVIERDDNMIPGVIIILPAILAIILVIGAFSMSDEHYILKIFLFLISFPLFFIAFNFASIAIIKFYNWPEMNERIGGVTWTIGIIFFIILVYFLIYMINKGIRATAQDKDDQMGY